jgi:predicted nuclease with TOPRIM domain
LTAAQEIATNCPDSLSESLQERLKIALELPRELIAENGRLHQEIEKREQDMRAFEAEVSQMAEYIEVIKGENQKFQIQIEQFKQGRENWQEGVQRCFQWINKELLGGTLYFDKKVVERLNRMDFLGAVEYLETALNQACKQMDMVAIIALHRQLFNIANVAIKRFQKLE